MTQRYVVPEEGLKAAAVAIRRMYLSPEPEVDRINYYCKTGDGKYVLLGSAAPGEPFVHNTPPEPEGPVLGVRGERLRAELEKRHWVTPPTIGNTEIEADIAAFVEAVLLQVNPPQPSVPEEIADLMISPHGSYICESQLKDCRADCDRQNARTLEAYRRGKTANQ